MAKRKYPSELNSRTIRVNIGDWQWLNSLSQKLGITVAETFHKVIAGLDHKAPVEQPIQPTQIPMPVTIAMPTMPAHRAIPTIAYRGIPLTAITTNGNKAVAFRIKPRGVRNG